MLQLKEIPAELLAGRKVLKADEYRAFVDAKSIVSQAEAEAICIVNAAKQEYESQKQQGYQDGLAEGRIQTAEQMVSTVGKTVEYFSGIEEKVADIVENALKKILGEMEDRSVVLKVVRNALAVVRNQSTVTLRVCPDEATHVEAHLSDLLGQYAGISFLEITPDPRLQKGGCILETEIGVVDASVDVQLEAICEALRRSIKSLM